jgi:hypothetical protein
MLTRFHCMYCKCFLLLFTKYEVSGLFFVKCTFVICCKISSVQNKVYRSIIEYLSINE